MYLSLTDNESGASVLTSRVAYSHLSDRNGALDCLAMKSLLAKWRGDEHAVAQADGLYAQLVVEKQVADLSI